MTEEQVRHARDLLARPENAVTSIAELLCVPKNTICNYVPELKPGGVGSEFDLPVVWGIGAWEIADDIPHRGRRG
ncbi:hypothetical protein SATRM34S_06872 [Streptomyces atroolivaceus]